MANITNVKVVKFTPPAPNPNRPALGGNSPLSPDSHSYHGDPPTKTAAGQHAPPATPIPATSQQEVV